MAIEMGEVKITFNTGPRIWPYMHIAVLKGDKIVKSYLTKRNVGEIKFHLPKDEYHVKMYDVTEDKQFSSIIHAGSITVE